MYSGVFMSKPYRSVVYSSSIHVILSLIKQRAKENKEDIHEHIGQQPCNNMKIHACMLDTLCIDFWNHFF